MNKFTCQCNDCKAKYEVIITNEKDIVCPGCSSKSTKIQKQEDIEASGCNDCSSCPGCH